MINYSSLLSGDTWLSSEFSNLGFLPLMPVFLCAAF